MTKFSIRRIYKNPKWNGQTIVGLEHLQSLIDLRQRGRSNQSHVRFSRKSDQKIPTRIVFNVSGTRFETFVSTLERYPNTLLGNSRRRALFYDHKTGEYFFDRHRVCFEAILYYYQSHGRLRRPEQVPLDTFLEEITFFNLGLDALAQVRQDEELEEVPKIRLPKNRFCRHLWANLEYPRYSMAAKIINIFSIILILLSVCELAIETLPNIRRNNETRCEFDGDGLMIEINNSSATRICSPNFKSPFFIIQSVCIAFFTLEFILRLISCPSFMEFIQSALNWIDFLSIVPYYIVIFINLSSLYDDVSLRTYFALSLLRIFRFLRICKFYRIFQHVKTIRVLASTLQESIPDFLLLLSFLGLSGFVFGAAMYFAENEVNGTIFDSIPTATYYGIITLTAVGYGDITPVTLWGRILACFAAIYGIGSVSMLVSILVGRYQRVFNRKRFLNDDYSEDMMFNDRFSSITDENLTVDTPVDPPIIEDEIDEEYEPNSVAQKSEMSSSKVRFIIGYMSDDDNDNDGDNEDGDDKTDCIDDDLNSEEAQFIHKLAQNLLNSRHR